MNEGLSQTGVRDLLGRKAGDFLTRFLCPNAALFIETHAVSRPIDDFFEPYAHFHEHKAKYPPGQRKKHRGGAGKPMGKGKP